MRYFAIVVLLLFSFNTYSQTNDTIFLRLHTDALKTFDYDIEEFDLIISQIDSLKKQRNNEIFISDMENSLVSLKNGKHDRSLEICYKHLFNSELTFLDSIIINQQIGKTYFDLGEHVISEKHLKLAYNTANKHHLNSSSINNWLVNIFYATAQNDSAIYYLKENNYNSKKEVLLNYSNIGLLFENKPDSSKFYLFKALQILKKKSSAKSDDYKFIYVGLGKANVTQNNLDSALFYFKKTIEDTAEIINWYPYITANVGIVDIYKELNQMDSAKFYVDNFFLCPCLDYATNIWLHQLKADYYLSSNNLKEYKLQSKQSNLYKDSLITQLKENINEVSSMNVSHFSMIEENLRVKNENLQISNDKNTAFKLMIALIIIVFGLIFTGVIFRSKKKKELYALQDKLNESKLNEMEITKSNLQLEVKNKNNDLNNLVSNLVLKKDFISEQKNSLTKLLKLNDTDLRLALKKYYIEFSSFETLDNNLSTLQSNIEEVNSKLIANLKSKFPKLTENDIQICILHLLKLSTKEIASLRNVTPKTIQTSRYRIKKKMGLNEDDNIIDYIENHL